MMWSLYNVPIKQALEVIRKTLEEDKTLSDSTNLDANDVMMSTTYFEFDGQYYQQVHGAPMGSPVSVVMSDMFMEHLEEEAIHRALPYMRPKIWWWYIDDSFEVVDMDTKTTVTIHYVKGVLEALSPEEVVHAGHAT